MLSTSARNILPDFETSGAPTDPALSICNLERCNPLLRDDTLPWAYWWAPGSNLSELQMPTLAPHKRLSFAQAAEILNQNCLAANGKPASTNKRAHKDMNAPAKKLDWWLQSVGAVPNHENPRSIAYLRSYIEIAGPLFFASGIPLTDGYLYPDRGVMKAMLLSSCVTLDEADLSTFRLTDAGHQLLLKL